MTNAPAPWSNPLAFRVIDVPSMLDEEGFTSLFIGTGYAALLMARLGESNGQGFFQMRIEGVAPEQSELAAEECLADYCTLVTSRAGWERSGEVFAIEVAVVVGRLKTSLVDPRVRDRLVAGLEELRGQFQQQIADAAGNDGLIDAYSVERLDDMLPTVEKLLTDILKNGNNPPVLH